MRAKNVNEINVYRIRMDYEGGGATVALSPIKRGLLSDSPLPKCVRLHAIAAEDVYRDGERKWQSIS